MVDPAAANPNADVTAHHNPRGLDVNLRSGPQMREYRAIVAEIRAHGAQPVLDWGCGWGQVSALLHAAGLGVESYDYRKDAPLQEVALERYPPLRAQVSGEPVALPFPDGHFGAVLSCGVLEHVQDPDGSLEEIRRVLAPGGMLFVYKLPNRRSYLEAIARRAGLYYHGALPHDRLYDLESTRAILLAHGFRVRRLALANLLPLTLTHPLAERLSGPIWSANRALARVPGLAGFATNVEAVASLP